MATSNEPDLRLTYQPPSTRPKNYNILLIVVDDLRPDLQAYGYGRNTMPFLESRLPGATVFLNCHSPAGWTLPACASIITGLVPDQHRLYDHNQKFNQPKICHYLGDSYFQIGITNNGNMVSDHISTAYLESIGHLRRPDKWSFFGWDSGFDHYCWTHREDHETPFKEALNFFRSPGDKPYFMFFHTNIVHDYDLDREYYRNVQEWLGEDLHPALHGFHDGPGIWRTPPAGLDMEFLKFHIKAKYDSGIRYADYKLEELFKLVNFDNTIVVLVSDHGEGFEPEYGRVHHTGRLHNDLTHVPLVIWLPPELRARYKPPHSETRFCSTVDIVPTLLKLLGDDVAGFPGQFLFNLKTHRELEGCDRGYIYWNDDCVRESYDNCEIEIRSSLTYPLKTISIRRNEEVKEYVHNLAYDPAERCNLLESTDRPISNFEPITFLVAVNDSEELHHNLLASPVAKSSHHQWILVENFNSCKYDSISRLYYDALDQASHDLVFFFHQDVYLPPGWEEQLFFSLAELEGQDSRWGVIGAVGVTPFEHGKEKVFCGHWCDPHPPGYWRRGNLPQEVQALDEQWLGIRKSNGIQFDPTMPGFHCYGIDLSLTARKNGRKSYAIDAFVWHKYRDSRGNLVWGTEGSEKILRRSANKYKLEYKLSSDFIVTKWKKYLPFHSTSMDWPDKH